MTISSSSSWIFKITHIEEPVIPSIFHPHSSSWVAPPFRHAPKLRQCLLLGLVEIKVKAIPPSNKKQQLSSISAEVRLDLGFEQFFCITLQANAEGGMGFVKTPPFLNSLLCNLYYYLQGQQRLKEVPILVMVHSKSESFVCEVEP